MAGGSRSQTAGQLHFRLLGPVEAWRDGEQLRLGGERQRGLLARLLLSANELVTTDRLVEELFGADVREDGLRSLRVAVSRLRRLLDDGDEAEILITRPGGYELRVEPQRLDLSQFESMLQQGRRAADEGDFLSASVTLREALALWRGPPLADLSGLEFAQGEIRRLEELHVAGLMDRIDADLALGRHAQVIGELEALIADHPLQERARGQLMLALYRSGRQADALTVYRETSDLLRSELGLGPSRALQDLERSMLQQSPELELAPPAPEPPAAPVCPFKGLASFERGDAEYFRGREALVTDLIALAAASGLVGLVGPSGVGKSSALRAGLLSALAAGALPGSTAWPQIIIRPGTDPNSALQRALGGRTLLQALDELGPEQRLVVAIDQFEELFISCADAEEREAFLSALVSASDDRHRCLVLVALRADFYGRSVTHPGFARRLNRAHVLAGPMDRAELRRAIEEPAQRAGLQVEPALTEALVSDVATQPGGLPLLSTALLELWQARDGTVLTYESYHTGGGVGGAVARLAEAAYQGLEVNDRATARTILLRLTTGDGTSLARRRVPVAELAGQPAEQRVVAVLTAERLMTVSDEEVEISHEALTQEWPRYRDWIEEDRVERRLQSHLMAQAREWDSRGRDRADLYRGARLTAALEWSSARAGDLEATEREFLAASEEQAELDARQQRARNRRLRGLLAGAALLLVLAVAAIIVAVDKQQSASTAARVALADSLGAQAIVDPHLDQAMLLGVEAVRLDPSEQTQGDLLTTVLRAPSAMRTLHGDNLRASGMAISPDGRTLALEDNVPNILFLDASTGRRIGEVPKARLPGPPSVLAFSPDGRLVIFGGANPPNQVDLIDPSNGVISQRLTLPHSVQDATAPATSFSPSPNFGGNDVTFAGGHRMAVAVAGFAVQWSLPEGSLAAMPFRVPDGASLVLYTSNGRQLIAVANARTSVLDADTGRVLRSYGIGGGAAAVSGDGHTMIFGEANGSVRFLDLRSGVVTTATAAHDGNVSAVGFTPDGKTAITSGDDGKSRIWDVGSHQVTRTLAGHAGGIHVQAVSPDGRTLYTGGVDGNALAWDLSGQRGLDPSFLAVASDPAAGAWNVAVTRDGRLVAVGGTDGTVNVWSTSSLREVSSFRAGPGVVAAVSFAPDGRSLLVAGDTQPPAAHSYMGIWRMGTPPRLLHLLHGLDSRITWATFGPSGGVVAATGAGSVSGSPLTRQGLVAEWSAQTGRLLAKPTILPPGGEAVDVSFAGRGTTVAAAQIADRLDVVDPARREILSHWKDSAAELTTAAALGPDGQRVATADYDGFLRVWNATTGRPELPSIRASELEVNSVNWSPDGRRLVTAGGDGTVRLYDATSGQQIGTSLLISNPVSPYATYSANGRTVAVTDATGRVWLYPAGAAGWESYACRVANRRFTRSEWSKFVPGQSYRPVCSAVGAQ